MSEHGPLAREISATARLGGPLIVAQVFQVGMGFTDTVMAGHISTRDLAAIAIGTTLWLPIYLTTIGLLTVVSPTVAQLRGADRLEEIGPLYRQALWLALLVAVFITPLTAHIGVLGTWIGVDQEIVPVSNAYLAAVSWGMPAVCLYLALRFVGEGIGFTRPVMYIQFAALIANFLGNYVLMFGKLGFPALGAVGAGWSTAVVMWLDAVLIIVYGAFHSRFRELNLFARFEPPSGRGILTLLRIGLPIAATMVMETSLFAAVSLLMGTIGKVAVAAHQVAINYASLMFMIPLGLSMATTVRVGQAVGAGDFSSSRQPGFVGIGMAVVAMGVSALVMFVIPEKIVGIYTSEPDVATLAVELLYLAALFQVSDGLQVGAVGALRGLRDTTWPMCITFVAYWILGLPLAYWLGIKLELGPSGLWAGLIVGLTFAAVFLTVRFWILSRRMPPLQRTPATDV